MHARIKGIDRICRHYDSRFLVLHIVPCLQRYRKLLDADIGAVPGDYERVYMPAAIELLIILQFRPFILFM
jgi:hypothetical protein